MVPVHEVEGDDPLAVAANAALSLPGAPDLVSAERPPGIEFHVNVPPVDRVPAGARGFA